MFSPSLQKAPRPLLPTPHDRILPRRILSSWPRGQGKSRRCWYVPSIAFQHSTYLHPECYLCATILLSPIFSSTPLANLHTGVLTKEFLDFSASRGNNLRSIGLEPGCKWCLCTARWKEAMEAAKGKDDPVVPKCENPPNISPID